MIGGGGMRGAQPVSRQTAYRTQAAPSQSSAPIPHAAEPPRPSVQQAQPRHVEVATKKKLPMWAAWAIGIACACLLLLTSWMLWTTQRGAASAIDTDKYQAVFLSNGQVYFGKMSFVNSEYVELSNVYYLERQATSGASTEADKEATPTTDDNNNFQLLKYSDVLYGSEDKMVISKSDMIRFENLKNDGVVARAIKDRQ